jgi:hypothetical protein
VTYVDDENFASTMDEAGDCREDLQVPASLRDKYTQVAEECEKNNVGVMAVVWKAIGEEHILDFKPGKPNK